MLDRSAWITNAARSRKIDELATSTYGLSGHDLVESAGAAVFREIEVNYPGAHVLVVLCGKGNNAADGYVVGRLAAAGRWAVRCVEMFPPEALCATAVAARNRAKAGNIVEFSPGLGLWDGPAVIVDAVFGTGFTGELPSHVQEVFGTIQAAGAPIVAVDVPSGVGCDTGLASSGAPHCDLTVTFGCPKPFLFQGPGQELAGTWVVDPILFPAELLDEPTDAVLIGRDWVRTRLPGRRKAANKGDFGKLQIVAGSAQYPGAASLVAGAALRAGTGLVFVESGSEKSWLVNWPEAIPGTVEAATATVFGPGLGTSAAARERYVRRGSLCLDADGLNLLAAGEISVPAGAVLTPHPGEAARLLETSPTEVQADRWGSARRISQKYGCTCVLKGAATVIATEGQPLCVNPTGNPGMASPGMGDVLAGIIGSLLAQGVSAHEAAVCSVYWHGVAGDLAAEEIGPVGFLASDVIERLPRARSMICG